MDTRVTFFENRLMHSRVVVTDTPNTETDVGIQTQMPSVELKLRTRFTRSVTYMYISVANLLFTYKYYLLTLLLFRHLTKLNLTRLFPLIKEENQITFSIKQRPR